MGWDPETTYRGVSNYHNNRMAIPLSVMKELKTHLSFTQLRFHCSKQQGRTFHVTTVANSTGEAVVQYFSGETDARPLACNSFKRLDGDNSQLAMQCDRWGSNSNGKWGNRNRRGEYMMYTQSAFIPDENRWSVANGKWWCDDHGNNMISSGDFWKVYVRWDLDKSHRIVEVSVLRHLVVFSETKHMKQLMWSNWNNYSEYNSQGISGASNVS